MFPRISLSRDSLVLTCKPSHLQGLKGSKGDVGDPGMPGEKGGIGLPGLPVCFCVPIKMNNQKVIILLAAVSSNHSYHLLIFKIFEISLVNYCKWGSTTNFKASKQMNYEIDLHVPLNLFY